MLVAAIGAVAAGLGRAPSSHAEAGEPSKIAAPAGLEVWRQDLLERVTLKTTGATVDIREVREKQDSRRILERPEVAKWVTTIPKASVDGRAAPVVIVGCRNGAFSGQVVVRSAGEIQVTATELKADSGEGTIPVSALRLTYGLLDGNRRGELDRVNPWFFGLEEIPADGKVPFQNLPIQPIWITVNVPKDAVPGPYSGLLNIASGATAAKVDIRLRVANWVLQDSKAFGSHMGLFQSPETLALKYKVPMWSAEHWKLIEKSFALISQWGNKEIYLPAINRTHLGNEHSMVRYARLSDGSYRPDFGLAERYLDLALKYFGKPPVICLYAWEFTSGGLDNLRPEDYQGPSLVKQPAAAATCAVLDPKTGELSEARIPPWGTPESVAFWRPVVDGLREILRKRDLEKSLMLGLSADITPKRVTITDFQAAAPGVKWVAHTHPYLEKLPFSDVPLGLGAFVWGARGLRPTYGTELQCGWMPHRGRGGPTTSDMIYCWFPRKHFISHFKPELLRYRVEYALASGMNGISRQGADFWLVDLGGRSPASIAGRYGALPGAVDLARDSSPCWLSAGKRGPIPTAAFEVVREGLEDCEARICIEKALTAPALCAKLGADLEKRCREALADRVALMLALELLYTVDLAIVDKVKVPDYVPLDWQRQSERLFALADEVTARLGVGE
jgi:hypothetical protein